MHILASHLPSPAFVMIILKSRPADNHQRRGRSSGPLIPEVSKRELNTRFSVPPTFASAIKPRELSTDSGREAGNTALFVNGEGAFF